jgi:DNA-binding NarL/FixJ family response regulator
MIKLMIADDDAKVRSAINLLLDQDRVCWQVIAEVCNVNELFLMVEQEKPQMLLLDWELPEDRCGNKRPPYFCLKDRIHHLLELNSEMYIIVLSSKPQVKSEALEAGANDFVSKGDPPEIFLNALYAIYEKPPTNFIGQPKKKSEQRNFEAIIL